MDHPQLSLLQRFSHADESAARTVFERYGALVRALACRFSRNRADAEDAMQEVFVEVWRKAERFDPGRGSESNFVSLIARRRLIDRQRRRRASPDELERPEGLENPRGAEGLERVDTVDEARHARSAFASLHPEQQRVLHLMIYEGLSDAEISRATRLPVSSVKTQARRGLSRVRKLLGVDVEPRRLARGA